MFTSSDQRGKGLVEALDHAGRPICLLSPGEIEAQKLPHRAVAVLAVSHPDCFLLKETDGPVFDVTASGPLAAGFATSEYAEHLLAAECGHSAHPEELFTLNVSPAIISVFCARFSRSMLKALCTSRFLLADRTEIQELAKRVLISPILAEIIRRLPGS